MATATAERKKAKEESAPVVMSGAKPRINRTPVNLDSIEAMTQEQDKKVTGTFVNIECPGQTAKICCKYYRGMEYFSYVFQDNEKATIPWSVARHINERCQAESHTNLLDDKGNPIKGSKKQARYKFIIESFDS